MDSAESVGAGLVSIEGEASVLARFHECFELGLPRLTLIRGRPPVESERRRLRLVG